MPIVIYKYWPSGPVNFLSATIGPEEKQTKYGGSLLVRGGGGQAKVNHRFTKKYFFFFAPFP